MEREKLIINKDNYKGYAELYRFRRFTFYKECGINQIKLIKKSSIAFGVVLMSILITAPFISLGLLPNIAIIEAVAFMPTLGFFSIEYFKKTNNYKKKHIENIKLKYPYVDTEIKIDELEHSLIEAKIITVNNNEYTFNPKRYENYLKVEEEKEKYFEETKYDRYIVNPEIKEKELEKPKVKKLIR